MAASAVAQIASAANLLVKFASGPHGNPASKHRPLVHRQLSGTHLCIGH
jgi:hypothetical protein